MKTLKLNHELAKAVYTGKATVTWRLNDDKNITVNDDIEFIDKVDPIRPDSWRVIGKARVNQVVEKRLGEITDEELAASGTESRTAMLHNYKEYYGQEVSGHSPVKIIHFSFAPYETPIEPVEIALNQKEIKLFADGGSRGNPGPSASGYVLLDMDDNIIKKGGVYLGVTTNNQAEYQALRFGLEDAQKLGAREVDVYMDSLLVVNQMKGIFKVRNRDLWPIHEAIKEQVKGFKKVTFTHVPRELNKLADAEVNETLDAETKT
jgi:ribonuclease HI